VAIWGRSLGILIFTAGVWFCNFGFAIYSKNHFVLAPLPFPGPSSTKSLIFSPGVTQGTIEWVPSIGTCLITRTERFRWGITVNFIVEEILLGVMFSGVLNMRNTTTGLWRVLYIQVCSRPFRSSDFPNSMYSTFSGSFVAFCCVLVGDPTFSMSSFLFPRYTFSDARDDRHLVG
jgi:hypothetical protein